MSPIVCLIHCTRCMAASAPTDGADTIRHTAKLAAASGCSHRSSNPDLSAAPPAVPLTGSLEGELRSPEVSERLSQPCGCLA